MNAVLSSFYFHLKGWNKRLGNLVELIWEDCIKLSEQNFLSNTGVQNICEDILIYGQRAYVQCIHLFVLYRD